ncbi:ribonuclease catalytic domain-containing protein [Desulfosudis oleivorans]|uniref:Exoribonuclease II n=1 Tax=Desulfosudis oleivorans (strain DSM 6200 / JCM 39069 / Hxd3) TaxID=96561 RepID=A8ZTJ4_DESOH|nr:ribonuclease catalytic domain-containing protein [Desulfosudis oleivorans]ABW66258.1 Exoribonuclease II [Desulfosudis oleivorans Hxd3]
MEKGTIIDFIDSQKMICAVATETSGTGTSHLRLLTENGREVKLPLRRASYAGGRLNPSVGRQALVDQLKATAHKRSELAERVDIKEVWDLLKDEDQWIDLASMTGLCFSGPVTPDHEAAVVRAIFDDRLYFKFDHNRFYPHTEEQIHAICVRRDKEARQRAMIHEGAEWLKKAGAGTPPPMDETARAVVDVLADYYVFEKEAKEPALAREILGGAGNLSPDTLFSLLVRLGVWDEHENIDLLRHRVPVSWPDDVTKASEKLVATAGIPSAGPDRVDLTGLSLFTIDGSQTLDFDDALSLEPMENGACRLGIHISDVGHYIKKEDPLDAEALKRGSSIYTADKKIPMLPAEISEGLCSLVAGKPRPAISMLITLSSSAEVMECRVVASVIRVENHLTYSQVNLSLDKDERLGRLSRIAVRLREKRVRDGALLIEIPELYVQFDDNRAVVLAKGDRESPSRILIEEMMILANTVMARFLKEHGLPAIFRSQPEPKTRLFKKGTTGETLFQNWVQRKMVARVVVDTKPERHCGLGVDLYTSATSPIRKYADLITQRQVRAALGLETPYTEDQLQHLMQMLQQPLSYVGKIQQARHRYWVFKHLETKTGQRVNAIVLDRFKNEYSILLPDYLTECRLPMPPSALLKPKDTIQVTIQHVNARNGVISVFCN